MELEILLQIRKIVLRKWCVRFSLAQMDANRCADIMSRKGASEGTEFSMWFSMWDELHDLITVDVAVYFPFAVFCFLAIYQKVFLTSALRALLKESKKKFFY